MEYRNFTQFPSLAYEGVDQHDQEFHVAVLRMTLNMCPDDALKIAEKQTPLVAVDEYYGEMNKSSVRQESDLVQYKPKCDVIVIGTAYAPGNKAVPHFEAGIRITGSVSLDKRLVINGPRFWEKHNTGWTLTDPAPIASLPLQYEYAYGGECRIDHDDPAAKQVEEQYHLTPEQKQQHPDGPEQAPIAHTAYEQNPVGKGYAEEWYIKTKGLTRIAAPQIESPLEPIREFGKHYAPQGVGVITKAWTPRRQLVGTIDKEFIDGEEWLPEDFDFAFWNGANPDMQIPFPKGDESIELINLMPHDDQDKQDTSVTKFVMPGHAPYLLARFAEGEIVPIDFNNDTLIINSNEMSLTLIYRAVLPKEPEVRALETRMMTREEAMSQDTVIKQIKDELGKRETPESGRNNG